jgi:uroporphyrinogen-III decarboxylase
MDLAVEKEAISKVVFGDCVDSGKVHFAGAFDESGLNTVLTDAARIVTPRMAANCEALQLISRETSLVPIGMSIGPFSLMTKLIADPILPIYSAGEGLSSDEDEQVKLVEQCLALAAALIRNSLARQIDAGAQAVFVCEPAANRAYISPKQLARGSKVFESYVMAPNRAIKKQLDEAGADLIFHDCGELTDDMVRSFGELDPAILSLGSSRVLWEDARLVPDRTVIYGNLPSKKFYSDAEATVECVKRMSIELIERMKATGHPFILGTECDVLAVPGSENKIAEKIEAFMSAKD